MLDLGVYVVSFAQYFLGTPDRIAVNGSLTPTGVDAEAGLLLGYDDGRVAALLISLKHQTPGAARIQGTKGWIDVPPRFHHPHRIVLQRKGQEPETINRPPLGTGPRRAASAPAFTDRAPTGRARSSPRHGDTPDR